MYFKVRIKCGECGCAFELEPFQFKECSEFVCPNCGQRLSDSVSSNLRAGLTAFALIPNETKDGGKFSFSVDVPEKDTCRNFGGRAEADEEAEAEESRRRWGTDFENW